MHRLLVSVINGDRSVLGLQVSRSASSQTPITRRARERCKITELAWRKMVDLYGALASVTGKQASRVGD